MNLSPIKSVLIIKLRYLGDVLLITPCMQAIKENLPHVDLTVVVNKETEPMLRHHPCVDNIITVDRHQWFGGYRTVMRLLQHHYDLVLDLTDGDRSAILTLLVNARYRVGYNAERRWRGYCYDWTVRGDPTTMHTVQYHIHAVKEIGLNGNISAPTLLVSSDDDRYANELLANHGIACADRLVMIHPGSRWEAKSWLTERFAAVADRIQSSRAARVVFAGIDREHARVKNIQSKMMTTPISIIGQTTVLQLAAVMKRCLLFVGNDNGPMHMAAAVGLPVVAIFGPTTPKIWGPWGTKHRVLYKNWDCRTCYVSGCHLGPQSCMAQVSVDEVMDAVDNCLAMTDQKERPCA